MLFVVLVASSVGVFGPILMSTFIPVRSNVVLTILKQFGTGIIISTAFVHVRLPLPIAIITNTV
jgi:zinc transporter 1/2/3